MRTAEGLYLGGGVVMWCVGYVRVMRTAEGLYLGGGVWLCGVWDM